MKVMKKKKKNGYVSTRKITEQIRSIDDKMTANKMEINSNYEKKIDDMAKNARKAKSKVFQYIQTLREIKRNLLYFKEYFTEREKYLLEQKNYPELAFVWSVHKDIINEYLLYMDEMRKEDLSKIANDLDATIPNILITNETFGFNKAKEKTEISNKRNIMKNDGFDKGQKEENYLIIEKTRNLISNLRKKMKDKKKRGSQNNEDTENNGEMNDDATTDNTFLDK